MRLARILDRYIFKETALTYIYTFVSFMFLMCIGSFLKQMELGLPFSQILTNAPYIVLINIPFVMPLGFITGYILTFSRLSVDHEIQILRSSGISLLRIITPHLIGALLLSLAAVFVYQDIIPSARKSFFAKLSTIYKDIPPITETFNQPSLTLNKGRTRVYVMARDTDGVRGIAVLKNENGHLTEVTFARKARIIRKSASLLTFEMDNVSRLIVKDDYIDHPTFERLSYDVTIKNNETTKSAGNKNDMLTGSELIHRFKDKSIKKETRRAAELRYWLRMALAAACFAFTVFAIPAGILSSQKSKASGFIRSILYALVIFFPLLMGLRSILTAQTSLPGNLLMLPNWLFIGYGLYSLRKVLRI